MKSQIRMSIIRERHKTISLLIEMNDDGDVTIVDERRPRLEADRSLCLRFDTSDVILSVEKAEL